MTQIDDILSAKPGIRIARGVARLLSSLGHAPLTEFVPSSGLRVDLISIAPKGEIWIIECKSCAADLRTDRKWQNYLEWCDRYLWAVDSNFPQHLLPEGQGLIVGDAWGAELVQPGPRQPLAPARRARILRDVARVAALRLQALNDPMGISPGAF